MTMRFCGMASSARDRRWGEKRTLRMKSSAKLAEAPEEGLNGFKLEEFLPYQLSVTANNVSRLFAKKYDEEYGLSIPEWRVLVGVRRFGTDSATTVSEGGGIDNVH